MSDESEVSQALPEPPFAPELIADLHAGLLDEKTADHVRARLPEDPDAQETLDSLTATVEALRGTPAPAVAVPPELRAASEATLARLAGSPTEPPADDVTPSRSGSRFSTAWLVAAAVVGVLLGGVAVAAVMTPGRLTAPPGGQVVTNTDVAPLLAAARAPQAEPIDPNRLARCLAANRLRGAAIIGAGYLDYRGHDAQVILTPTGQPGRFNALVTTRDCDAGKPGTLARAVVAE
ncbi:hypothetical protein GOARA_087_00090 [Gordonia araii NBRC 100433]|uniref:Anti-sigma-M factor RsmA n=1 Tax=Gordonia araii NBRC 100433 TaxID=1073574 RepID=G7H791_9ACTN|nr:hypothetical protein [Gordonia araii]NNG99035.1 hypothetical protein [Gordonia araii NBRC 100433]GAB11716.1 hypothetical protein GOARA_087_00090 [Gordonia araii NBRC 100433]